MKRSFPTPQDLLEEIQLEFGGFATNPAPVDPAFTEANREAEAEIARLGLANGSLEGALAQIARTVLDSICEVLPVDQARAVRTSVAAGFVPSPRVFAEIQRSEDDKYAIVIATGLAERLNDVLVVEFARANRDAITYCSDRPVAELTDANFDRMWGTAIRPKPGERPATFAFRPPAHALAGSLMFAGVALVMAHEIGHFCNGDLSDGRSFAAMAEHPFLREYVHRNATQRQELAADAFAVKVLFDLQRAGHIWPSTVTNASILVTLLLILGAENAGPSESHPSVPLRLALAMQAAKREALEDPGDR